MYSVSVHMPVCVSSSFSISYFVLFLPPPPPPLLLLLYILLFSSYLFLFLQLFFVFFIFIFVVFFFFLYILFFSSYSFFLFLQFLFILFAVVVIIVLVAAAFVVVDVVVVVFFSVCATSRPPSPPAPPPSSGLLFQAADQVRIRGNKYHLLGRREQVKIFRLRTGHNRLLHHVHTKFGIGQSGECPCGEGTNDNRPHPSRLYDACSIQKGVLANTDSSESQVVRHPGGTAVDGSLHRGHQAAHLMGSERGRRRRKEGLEGK